MTVALCLFRLAAEWISAKKDWQNAQKRNKERRSSVSVAAARGATAERPRPSGPILTDVVSEPPQKLEGEANHSHQSTASNSKERSRDGATYQPEMDEMRCILYAHGGTPTPLKMIVGLTYVPGGYYFGSVDQER